MQLYNLEMTKRRRQSTQKRFQKKRIKNAREEIQLAGFEVTHSTRKSAKKRFQKRRKAIWGEI